MCNAALTNLGFAKTSVIFLRPESTTCYKASPFVRLQFAATKYSILEIQTVKVGNLWDLFILRWILRPSSGCTTRNHKSSPWLGGCCVCC